MVDLKPLWRAQLDVYREVADICNRHSLSYYAAFGTAIGVVRHGGFIPWDDDIDLEMPRADFEKFIEIAQRELPPYYRIVSYKNTPGCPFNFIKVSDTRKDVVDAIAAESGHTMADGINLDIFPLCGVPAKKKFQKVRVFFLRALQNAINAGPCPTFASHVGRAVGLFVRLFSKIKTREQLLALHHRNATQLPFNSSEWVGGYRAEIFGYWVRYRRSWFDSVKMMKFEDVMIPVPVGVENILTTDFGDYMSLPPEEKRVPFHGCAAPQPWKYGPANPEIAP